MENKNTHPVLKFAENKWTPIIFGAAYALILMYVGFKYHKIPDEGMETDFLKGYVPRAESFLEGKILIHQFQGPFYPILLGIVNTFFDNYLKAGMFISSVSAGAFLVLSYKIIQKILRADIALAIVLVIAFNKYFVQYSWNCGTDMLFLALISPMIYFLVKDDQFKWKNLILMSVFAGISFMVRFNGLLLLIGIGFAFTVINVYKLELKKRLIITAAMFGIFFAMISPYGLYCSSEKGEFFYNASYRTTGWAYYGDRLNFNPETKEWKEETAPTGDPVRLGWEGYWTRSGEDMGLGSMTEIAFRDFGYFFSTYTEFFFSYFSKNASILLGGWHMGFFILLGIPMLLVIKPSKLELTVYLLGLIFYATLGLAHYNPRFQLFLLPFLLALMFRLFLYKSLLKEQWVSLVIPLLGLFLGAYEYNRTMEEPQTNSMEDTAGMGTKQYNASIIELGPMVMLNWEDWARQNFTNKKGTDVMWARKPNICFHVGLGYRNIAGVKNMRDMIDQLKLHNVKYVFSDAWSMRTRPFVSQFIQDPKSALPIFKHIHSIQDPETRVVQHLYKVELADTVKMGPILPAPKKPTAANFKAETAKIKAWLGKDYVPVAGGTVWTQNQEVAKALGLKIKPFDTFENGNELIKKLKASKVQFVYFGAWENAKLPKYGQLFGEKRQNIPFFKEVLSFEETQSKYTGRLFKVVLP